MVGGICAQLVSGTIDGCYNSGKIVATGYGTATGRNDPYVGGICGSISGYTVSEIGIVSNCYNLGTVKGIAYQCGGIVGCVGSTNGSKGNVLNCYCAGEADGASIVALGRQGNMSNCAYINTAKNYIGNRETNNFIVTNCSGGQTWTSKQVLSYIGSAFIIKEGMNDGLPVLLWQTEE